MNIDGYTFNFYCYPGSRRNQDVCCLTVTRLMSVYDTNKYYNYMNRTWECYQYQSAIYSTLESYRKDLTRYMKKSILLRNGKQRWSKRFDTILEEEKRHNCKWKALTQVTKITYDYDTMKQYLIMERA